VSVEEINIDNFIDVEMRIALCGMLLILDDIAGTLGRQQE